MCRILDITELDLKEINKTEALEKEYNLTIDFIQDLIPNVFGQTNPGGASDDV